MYVSGWYLFDRQCTHTHTHTAAVVLKMKPKMMACCSRFTVHYLRWRMPPFMRQCWGLPHRLAQCMSPQWWGGKLVNAALLSLINEAFVSVCCATLLLSELVGSSCVQARSSNPRGRVCRPSGKGSGRRRYWVALYLFIYAARLLMSVFF